MKEPTLIKINSADPNEAEYIAKVLINEASEQKRPVACSKTIKRLFGYEKRVILWKGVQDTNK